MALYLGQGHRTAGPLDATHRSGDSAEEDLTGSVAPDRSLAAGIGPAQPSPTDPL